MIFKKAGNRFGFSWPELIVSASVIALGLTLVTSSILSAHADSINTSRRNTVKQISLALETYYFHNGQYPPANINRCDNYEGYLSDQDNFMNSLVEPEYLPENPSDKGKTDCSIKYRDLDNRSSYKILWREIGTEIPDTGCNEPPEWLCVSKDL